MVLDASAVLAVLLKEPERDLFAEAISGAEVRLASAVNAFEVAIVLLARKGPPGLRELDLLFHSAGVDVVPFTDTHLILAREAFHRYGKGRHAAGLNLGDCCAYALSMNSGEPLLYKGRDFAQTDVRSAVEA